MKLKAKVTRTITTDDLEIYCDPPLTFEASGRINDKLTAELKQWYQNGYDPQKTLDLIPQLFLNVSQDGQTYPLESRGDAEALQEALGAGFLVDLVEAFWDYDFRFFQKRLSGSVRSLTALGSGDTSEPSP